MDTEQRTDNPIDAILASASWDELFESANAALASDFPAGCSPEARALRSLFWRKCAFPVACADSVPFRDPADSAKGPILPGAPAANGSALQAHSFSLAKLIAASLAESPSESSVLKALARIQSRQLQAASKVGSLSGLSPALSEGVAPLLLGWNAHLALSDVPSLQAEAVSLVPFLAPSPASPSFSPPMPPDLIEASVLRDSAEEAATSSASLFDRLRHAFGFSMISCGPEGGALQGLASAASIQEAFFALSRRLAAPAQSIGLGGLGVLLNCDLGPAGGALHGSGWSLAFSYPPGSVAHEWTHAFERHVEILGTAPQREALRAVREAIASMPRDPALATLFAEAPVEAERARQRAFLARILSVRGTPAAQELARSGEVPPDTMREWLSAMDEPDESRMLSRLRGAIASVSAPGYLPPDTLALSRQADRMAEAYAARSLRQRALRRDGKSVFALLAAEADETLALEGASEVPGYWSTPREMLARAAESFFHDDAVPALAWVGPEDFSSPKGLERASIERCLSAFMLSLGEPIFSDLPGCKPRSPSP